MNKTTIPSLAACALIAANSCASAADLSDIRNIHSKILQFQANETALATKFNPELVRLLDYNTDTGAFLFRGNMPVANNALVYQQLLTAMRKASPGTPMADKVFVVDISLVNEVIPAEANDLKIEKNFWQQNPTLGKLINHPVYGSLTSPNDYPSAVRKQLEKIPTVSKIDDLLLDLQALLKTPQMSGIPLAIYVHCEAGKDRTGEVAAAYAMKYQGVSYAAAYANANLIAERDISKYSKNELQWYAYYLKDIKKLPTIGPIK